MAVFSLLDEKAIFDFSTLKGEVKSEQDFQEAISKAFAELKKNKQIKSLEFQNLSELAPQYQGFVLAKLDEAAGFLTFKLEDPKRDEEAFKKIAERGKQIAARNKLLDIYKVEVDEEGIDLWDAAVKAWFDDQSHPAYQKEQLDYFKNENPAVNRCMLDMGSVFFEKVIKKLNELMQLSNQGGGFPYTVLSINANGLSTSGIDSYKTDFFGPESIKILKENIKSNSFERIKVDHSGDAKQALDVVNELILELPNSKVKEVEFFLFSPKINTEKNLEEWIRFAQEHHITTAINFNVTHSTDRENELQTKLYNEIYKNRRKVNKAIRLDKKSKDKQTILPGLAAKELKRISSSKIRASKLRTEAALSGLQTHIQIQSQKQQQQQQQQQQQLQQQAATKKPEKAGVHGIVKSEGLVDLEIVSSPKHEYVGFRETTQAIANDGIELKNDDLWTSAIGVGSLSSNIKFLTPSAAREFLRSPGFYLDGFSLDNLPKGFFLQETKKGEIALNYDRLSLIENKNESPLTVRMVVPLKKENCAYGDVEQFNVKLTDAKQDRNKLQKILWRRGEPREKLEILYELMNGEDPERAGKLIKEHKDIFEQLSSDNIVSLWTVFADEGCVGVEVLMEKLGEIKKLKGGEYFKSFKECFLDPSGNWLELMTEQSLASMDKIANFNEAELSWWQFLSEHHLHHTKWADLSDLFTGFNYFCEQYREITQQPLPAVCPLVNLSNMKVCLDRLLVILRNAKEANTLDTQLKNLYGLDLGPEGAYYASRNEGFYFVAPEMALSPMFSKSKATIKLGGGVSDAKLMIPEEERIYKVTYEQLKSLAEKAKIKTDFNPVKSGFYRFLGTQRNQASYDSYKMAVEKITDLALGSSTRHKAKLLPLLAFTTTHLRGYRTEINPALDNLIKILDGIKDSHANKVGLVLGQLLTWNSSEPPISLIEANAITAALIEVKDEKSIEAVNQKLRDCVTKYKEPFLQALVNLQKNTHRMSIDQFLKIIDSVSAESKFDLVTQGKLAVVLSSLNNNGLNDEKVAGLMNEIKSFQEKFGDQVHSLLDIVATIDVTKRAPLIDEMINAVKTATTAEYNALFEHIKTSLPGCEFSYANRLQALPVDFIQLIQKGAKEIVAQAKEQGVGLDEVRLIANPIDYLAKEVLPGMSFVMRKVVGVGIRKISSGIKEEKIQQGVKQLFGEIKADDEVNQKSRSALFDVIKNRLSVTFPDEKLEEELQSIQGYTDAVGKLITTLGNIKRVWPNALPEILAVLADNEKSVIGAGSIYSIDILNNTLLNIYENYKTKPQFPFKIFETLVNHPKLRIKDQRDKILQQESNLNKVFRIILDHDKLTTLQKERLIDIAINTAVNMDPHVIVTPLLNYQAIYPDEFDSLLAIFKKSSDVSQTKATIDALNDLIGKLDHKIKPEIAKKTFALFASGFEQDSVNFDKLAEVKRVEKRPLMLMIISQCCAVEHKQQQVNDLITGLAELKDTELHALSELFRTKPFPSFDQLSAHLKAHTITKLLDDFPSNPFGIRDPKLYDTSRVKDVIDSMEDLTQGDDRPLTNVQRAKLNQMFMLVNKLGNELPIYVGKRNGASTTLPAKDLKPEEIRLLIEKYRNVIADANKSEREKMTARLSFLALSREAMYRTTCRFPNSTQTLSVLSAMIQGGHTLSEIRTGQGKGLISAMYAAQLWLEGQTVDVCTSNSTLAGRDLDENAGFFDYLTIPHSVKNITADSSEKDYCLGGINYSDVGQLSLYRANMQIEGQYVDPKRAALVLDEADFTILDDSTHYRYAKNIDSAAQNVNPYAWIYPLLNDFIKTTQYKNTNASAEEDINNATSYLRNNAVTPFQKQMVEQLTRKQVDTWIDSAVAASQLKLNTHYVVREVTKGMGDDARKVSLARLLIHNRVSDDAQFSDGVQQFLHARLEKEKKADQPSFLIEPEIAAVASVSSKNFVDYYRERGVVWGITGTIGSIEERAEQQEKYQYKMLRIPPHQKNLRIDRKPVLAKNETNQQQLILKEIIRHLRQDNISWHKRDGRPQPMLIVCKDVESSKRTHEFISKELQKYRGKYPNAGLQLFNGSETIVNGVPDNKITEQDVVDQAGVSGWITIATPALGRGSDFKPRYHRDDKKQNHPKGLFTVEAFIAGIRDADQVKGRAGRQGQAGETILIANEEELGLSVKLKPTEAIEKKRKADAALSTSQRQLRDRQGDIKRSFFARFMLLYNAIPIDAEESIKRSLLRTWKDYLEDTDRDWIKIVEEQSRPGANATDKEKLAACSHRFIKNACDKWNRLVSSFNKTLDDNTLELAGKPNLNVNENAVWDHLQSIQRAKSTVPPSSANSTSSPFYEADPYQTYVDFNPLSIASLPEATREINKIRNQIIDKVMLQLDAQLIKHGIFLAEGIMHYSKTGDASISIFALLESNYERQKAGKAIPPALSTALEQVMRVVHWSQSDLQDRAFDAYTKHFKNMMKQKSKVSDSYLYGLRADILRMQNSGYFGKNDFSEWLGKQTREDENFGEANTRVLEVLQEYKQSKFIAEDRQLNVTKLIGEIAKIQGDDLGKTRQLLTHLNTAKSDAFNSDQAVDSTSFFKRKFESRYQKSLDKARKRIISSLDSNAIDELVPVEFADLKNLLQGLITFFGGNQYQNIFAKLDQLSDCFNKLSNDQLGDKEKYESMLSLVEQFKQYEKEINKFSGSNPRRLIQAIQSKCDDMALYFMQGRKLNEILNDPEIRYHNIVNRAIGMAKETGAVQTADQDKISWVSDNDDESASPNNMQQYEKVIACVREQMLADSSPGANMKVEKAEMRQHRDRYQLNLDLTVEVNQQTRKISMQLEIDPATNAIKCGWPKEQLQAREAEKMAADITIKRKEPIAASQPESILPELPIRRGRRRG